MRLPEPPKSTLGRMMEEEELMSKAAGGPPGHTYNKNIRKCLPGSPLAGIGAAYSEIDSFDFGKGAQSPPKPSKQAAAAVKINKEVQSRQLSQQNSPGQQ